MTELAWALRAVRGAPRGPQVGAFFDLDGTLVEGFTAVAFLRDFLVRGEISGRALLSVVRATAAHRGPDNGQALIAQGVALFAGWPTNKLEARAREIFRRRVARLIRADARRLVEAHRAAGHTLVLASAASAFQARPVAEDFGIRHLLTTPIAVRDGRVTGELGGPPLWGPEKAAAVRAFAQSNQLDLAESFAYGNGREDHRFLQTVGRPVAVRPDPGLAAIAARDCIPVLSLEAPPRPGLRGTFGTLTAIGAFNVGAVGTVVASRVVGKPTAFRYGFPWTADAALAAAGITVRTQGLEHIEAARPAVFIFNHQSNLDPLVVMSIVRRDVTGVGKAEVVSSLQTWILRFLDLALIDRSDSETARASLAALVARIQGGESVFVAPEGTRMPTPRLGPFKRGAFHLAYDAQVPLVPIVIRNSGSLWPRGATRISSGVVDVVVLPPVPTIGWSRGEIGEQADAVREYFAQTLAHWPESVGRIHTPFSPPKPILPSMPTT